jgi:uncharacterized radical SAM protein YgiQ
MDRFDIIFVLPYPFSDHPSFPEGILKRTLEMEGFSVGIIERPFWQKTESFKVLGVPRLFFAIIAGPVDSVVLNYTSSRKRRKEDLYQLGGNGFFADCPPSIQYKVRPDRTTIVFANRLREAFKDVPIVVGGIEPSLRLFGHYDFQQDALRRSILLDARADLAVTGMGEKQIVAIARAIHEGLGAQAVSVPGTAKICPAPPKGEGFTALPAFETLLSHPTALLEAQIALEEAAMKKSGVFQQFGERYVVAQRPETYEASDLDRIYGQPYTRTHTAGSSPSPALQMNLFSITSHRGCCGGCAFCAIGMHEGKGVVSRSPESIFGEVDRLTHHPQWKGVISDIGGASAEMYGTSCTKEGCARPSCLHPKACPGLSSVSPYLSLIRACRKRRGVRKVFVGSGVRYDILLNHPEALEEIMLYHCGRFLRIAPEHTSDRVLRLMRKPPFAVLEEFVALFRSINRGLRRKIELAPFLIVGHPGETEKDVRKMKENLRALGLNPTDVQIYTPSPGTLSTAMFYSGADLSFSPIPVERDVKALVARKRRLVEM